MVRVLALDTYVLMGLPLIFGSPPRPRESEPYPEGRLPTLRFSSCGQEHSFYYHHWSRYILFAHRQSDVGCLGFVLAPLPQALPGGEPCIMYILFFANPTYAVGVRLIFSGYIHT